MAYMQGIIPLWADYNEINETRTMGFLKKSTHRIINM